MDSNFKLSLLVLLLYLSNEFAPQAMGASGIKAGYWPSYLSSSFPAAAIDFSYFTHVYYAFVQPEPDTYELNITQFDLEAIPAFVAAAHAHLPPAKAMLTVGGGSSNLTVFGGVAATESSRARFIGSAIAVARRFALDGLDLDWEFPKDEGQMAQFGMLFVEWRAAVEKEAAAYGRPKLLLSAAVYYASTVTMDGVTRSYPAETMGSYLDWINAMCFDYHGGWNTSETGAPAALYDPTSNISTSYGIESWIAAGVPTEKVVMGIPLYGRSWELKNPSDNGVGAPAVAVGPGNKGVMVYSGIVNFNMNNNAVVVYDAAIVSAYSYAGTSWIGYDDPRSVATKVGFAKARELGGYFFWALGYDDKTWSLSRSASSAWGS